MEIILQALSALGLLVAFLFFVANFELLIMKPIDWFFHTILDLLKIGG